MSAASLSKLSSVVEKLVPRPNGHARASFHAPYPKQAKVAARMFVSRKQGPYDASKHQRLGVARGADVCLSGSSLVGRSPTNSCRDVPRGTSTVQRNVPPPRMGLATSLASAPDVPRGTSVSPRTSAGGVSRAPLPPPSPPSLDPLHRSRTSHPGHDASAPASRSRTPAPSYKTDTLPFR